MAMCEGAYSFRHTRHASPWPMATAKRNSLHLHASSLLPAQDEAPSYPWRAAQPAQTSCAAQTVPRSPLPEQAPPEQAAQHAEPEPYCD
jgi:hypothetical protein